MKVYENRMPGRIFEPKQNEGTGVWKKPNNEKFRIL
jgi:hypothetical protein